MLDEYKRRRIEERTKAIIATFTKEYLSAYIDALLDKIRKEYNQVPKEPKQLLTPPVPTEPIKEGYMTKEGGAFKSWHRRFFRVYPDYTIEYFDKPGGKKKGEVNLDGYKLIEEGKPGKPNSVELRHPKLRCWFFQADDEASKKEWMDVLSLCCRKASRATASNKDRVMAYAFSRAYERTRWWIGLWGWYQCSGSEGERLGELIFEELERDVLGDVWRTLPGEGKMREMAKNSVLKVVEGIVLTAVEAGWKAVVAGIEEVKKPFEETVRKGVEPIFAFERDLKAKIKETIIGTVEPTLQQVVVPPLAKVLDVVLRPVRESYGELFKAWQQVAEKFSRHVAEKGSDEKSFKSWMYDSYWEVRYYWGPMRPVVDKVNELREPLELLGDIASYVRAWRIIDDITDHQRELLYKACYTLTQDLPDHAGDMRAAIKKTSQRLLHDAQRQMVKEYFSVLYAVVSPPFNQEIIPQVTKLIEPLSSIVPEPMKKIINPTKTMSDLLKDLVSTLVRNCVDSATKDEPARLAETFSALQL